MTPAVSVIMPVHNGEDFLRESAGSLLSQTFRDFELIVVDDGSSDSTPAMLKELAAGDRRVRVHRQAGQRGIVEALNTALGLAAGKYLARMDADDISLPERFERQVRQLEANPEVGVLGANVRLIDAAGNRQAVLELPTAHLPICWSMCFYNPIVHPTVMARRELIAEAGGYRSGFPNAEDYDLWRRLIGRTQFGILPEVLLLLRKHGSNVTIAVADENLPSGIRIGREVAGLFLERDVPAEAMETIWDVRRCETGQIDRALGLIEMLFGKFDRLAQPSKQERAFIAQDAAGRVMSLAMRRKSAHSMRLVGKALSYSPSAVLRYGLRAVWGKLNQGSSS